MARDPNGLNAPGQHTSAYDEALIARRALALPAFLNYDQTKSALFEIKPRHRVGLVNQNLMLTGTAATSAARSAGPRPRAPPTSAWPGGTTRR